MGRRSRSRSPHRSSRHRKKHDHKKKRKRRSNSRSPSRRDSRRYRSDREDDEREQQRRRRPTADVDPFSSSKDQDVVIKSSSTTTVVSKHNTESLNNYSFHSSAVASSKTSTKSVVVASLPSRADIARLKASVQGALLNAKKPKEEAPIAKEDSANQGRALVLGSVNVNDLKEKLSKALAQKPKAKEWIVSNITSSTNLLSKTSHAPCSTTNSNNSSTKTSHGGTKTSHTPSTTSNSNSETSHESSLPKTLSSCDVVEEKVVALEDNSPPFTEEEEIFDMFAEDAHEVVQKMAPVARDGSSSTKTQQLDWDDADGYYRIQMGELLDNGKYRVVSKSGQGVFSTVVTCQVLSDDDDGNQKHVAIKLIRNNDTMRRASATEVKILNQLREADSLNQHYVVRLLKTFEHRSHVALVFESMSMNLRQAMKKFGGKTGINIRAVKIFCNQLLRSLLLLSSCDVVHADIKPDNILLDENQTMVKLCDFGSAFKLNDCYASEPTPYLVSRFYRAPEIVLGLPYDTRVDMWSIGCCLYEMFTGKVLFPGGSNNEMLKVFMKIRGRFSNKIIKRHRSVYVEKFEMEPHFDVENRFISRELDIVTGNPINRIVVDPAKNQEGILQILLTAQALASEEERQLIIHLHSLLDRMLVLDPAKRISVQDALRHPFVL